MSSFIQDLRYGFRTMARSPGFSLVAILTLALGIGANTAVFSVVNAVLMEPLPYRDSERLTLVWTNFGPDLPQNWISGPEYGEIRELSRSLQDFAVVFPFSTTLTGDGEPEQVDTGAASGSFFRLMGVQPFLGRLLGPEDDKIGAPPAAVISDGFWKRRFAEDPDVIGRDIIVSGRPTTVVGVLPADFTILHPDSQFPKSLDIWLPALPVAGSFFGRDSYQEFFRGAHFFRGIGRLEPGISLAQAQMDMDAVAERMRELSPNAYSFEGWGLTILSLHGDLVEEVRPALLILLGVVGFVLLIACVNVAHLMLARSSAREREIAVRQALGAGRRRLIRQLLTESIVLSAMGGLMGVFLAVFLIRAVALLAPERLPRTDAIAIDTTVLLFTAGISIGTGILFGLFPALRGPRRDLAESLKEGVRGATGVGRGGGARKALVVAEIGLALILLVGAGLLIKSFARLLASDPGFHPQNLLTLQVPLPGTSYREPQRIIGFYDAFLAGTRELPGVESAGLISQLPLSNAYSSGTTWVERSETLPEDQRAFEADRRSVSAGYFRTMGAPLIKGRSFTELDHAEAPPVAMVDEEFARRAWPSEDPIGQRVSINGNEDEPVWREVVGVVRHQKHYGLDVVGREQVYFPYPQNPQNSMFLVLRAASEPESLIPAVRDAVRSIDPGQPIDDVAPMAARVQASLSRARFNLFMMIGFASLALLLAVVGIYGVVAFSVSQRSHEIGVRMALGASIPSIRTLVLRDGLVLVGAALIAGGTGALALTRVMRGLLFGVTPTDPFTFLAMAALLLSVAVAACLIPAVRATRVDPVKVLHTE